MDALQRRDGDAVVNSCLEDGTGGASWPAPPLVPRS